MPLRLSPSHKSEMTSQVLFGEKYSVIERAGHWLRIITGFDSYSGWVDANHLLPVEAADGPGGLVLNKALRCYRADGSKFILEAGCEIYRPDFNTKTFRLADSIFTTSENFAESYVYVNETKADTALRFLNSPYIWGGRIPSGIDCSGFTQLVYKIHGIQIPRDSWRQAEAGVALNFLEEALPGDLLFFGNEAGRISHVGILLSQGLIIHASGRVRIDPVDPTGIFNNDLNRYSHRLRSIIRIRESNSNR